MASETINFGQIFAVAVVGFLLYRWFSGPALPSSTSSGRNGGRQVNPEHVEAVAQMYPQLDRRAIIWDLHRNGGSVQATVERLLGGRSLETASQPPRWLEATKLTVVLASSLIPASDTSCCRPTDTQQTRR